LNVC
jgi:hypothetical protein